MAMRDSEVQREPTFCSIDALKVYGSTAGRLVEIIVDESSETLRLRADQHH